MTRIEDFNDNVITSVWAPVHGHDGYIVSAEGQVLSLRRGVKILRPMSDNGYCRVSMYNRAGKNRGHYIHRLVLNAFIGPRPDLEGNHEDRNKRNNWLGNLNWASHQANMDHCVESGGYDHRRRIVVGKCVETGRTVTFRSINEAGRAGYSVTCVMARCRGETISPYRGFTWVYGE